MKFFERIRLPLLAAACLLAPAGSAFGQAVYGNIFGTVVDNTGAVIPNATIVISDEAKGTSVTLTSNGSGEFTAEHLIPDTYDVKVTAAGFKSFETKGLTVFADTSAKIEASLTVGGAGETIEVSADAIPQLKTDRADVSTEFAAQQIQDLPIGDRNFTNLQLLLPGAQQLGWSHAADENPQGSKQIDVDGQAFGGVAFQLDGTDNQDPILGIIVINPNIDSLSETKIATQNFDAEFGKAVSSVVTAQTKSGSNSFHGSAFDYRESNARLARDPFTQGPNQLTAASPFPGGVRSQFGGSLGGPILKDKAFFFADYQGVRQKVGISGLQSVPSANLVNTCLSGNGCDFSEYAAAINKANGVADLTTPVIYNPATGVAYAGNIIPNNQLSTPALNLLKLLQPYAPNNPGGDATYSNLKNNYAASGSGLFNSDQWDARADYQVTPNMHAFGRFSRFTDTLTGSTIFGAAGGTGFGLGGYGGNSKGANDSVAAGLDIAVNPKLLTDIRLGYYRYNIGDTKYNQSVPFATNLGIPGENLGTTITGGAPAFALAEVGASGQQLTVSNGAGDGPQYGGGLNVDRCNCPLTQREDQFQVVNNWTKTLGNHSVKFGADLRYARNLRVPSDSDRTGVNQFGTGPTSNPANNALGLGMATFVLGDVTAYNRYASTSDNAKEFQKRDFFYAQDTWRATQKLTVNAGLRYELYFPEAVNAKGNGSVMNLATGYFQVAGYGKFGTNMGYTKAGNPYNPRLGVAYQATDKTVIRAGYGRSFDLGVFGSLFGHVATQDLPVLVNQQLNTTTGDQGHVFDLATGPAAPYFNAVPTSGLLPAPGYEVSPKSRPTTVRLPTIDAWNLSIQQSVTPTVSFTIAYVGNKGTHTLSAGDGNNTNPNESAIVLPAQFSVTGTPLHYDPAAAGYHGILDRDGNVIANVAADGGTSNQTYLQRYYGGNLAACSDPLYTSQAAQYQAAVGGAYPLAGLPTGACGWSNSIVNYGDDQDTHYNALQVTAAKTFTHGYSINGSYAWQRAYDFNSSFATWNKSVTKGRSESIREQELITYGLFELPFGRNHHFFGNDNRLVDEFIGGWQISPVLTFSGGLPFNLSYSSCSSQIPGDAPCYVNGDPKSFKKHVTGYPGSPLGLSYYDKYTLGNGPFSQPGLDQIGNTGRNSVFGPNYFNTDMAVQKNFTIRESLVAQFRVDGYNAFNHINYGTPNSNIDQGGSIGSGPGPNGTQLPSVRNLQFSGRIQF